MFEGIGSAIGAGLGQVGDALSAPRRALWSALGAPESGSELVSKLTGMDPESGWTKALGFGAEVLGDPLTYAGGLFGKLGGAAAKGAEEASAVPKMLGLRRKFGFIKDAVPAAEADAAALASPRSFETNGLAGKLTGVPPVRRDLEAVADYAKTQPMQGGYFAPGENSPGFGITFRGSDPSTVRHELIHGIIDQARRSGDTASLPLAMRLPAMMQDSSSPLLNGLGRFAEEGAAQSLEHRGLGARLWNAARHTMYPDPLYVSQTAKVSPLAGKIVDYGPTAAAAGLLGAGAGAGGYLAFNR